MKLSLTHNFYKNTVQFSGQETAKLSLETCKASWWYIINIQRACTCDGIYCTNIPENCTSWYTPLSCQKGVVKVGLYLITCTLLLLRSKFKQYHSSTSQNHRLVWVGKDLRDHLIPPPCICAWHRHKTLHLAQLNFTSSEQCVGNRNVVSLF